LVGTKEIIGIKHSDEINVLGKRVGYSKYTTDEIPWCGLFVAYVCKKAGLELPLLHRKSLGIELE
jgi:hypothetical protein